MKHLVLAFVAAVATGAAHAQDASWPAKPIRFVVGQAPGGATDIIARLVAGRMDQLLGQNIIVENRTGAAGSIGAAFVARSTPDGYTVLVVSSSYSINPSLYATLPFDPQKDLAPVSLLAEAPFLLVVHPSLPARSVKELIALAKSKPGALTYGSGGNGSSGHLAGALFESAAGVKLSHIPYKGAGQALVDVLSGQITLTFASVLSSTAHVKAGRLRVLGVTGAKRSNAMPQVPTIAEAGAPGYSTTTWYGLLVPSSTPAPVVERLANAAHRTVMAPELRERMASDGAEPVGSTPAAFQKHIASEIAKWRKVVASTHVKAD
jgi:tripartite-type tricarboxylate transporter receptor subunit TctC